MFKHPPTFLLFSGSSREKVSDIDSKQLANEYLKDYNVSQQDIENLKNLIPKNFDPNTHFDVLMMLNFFKKQGWSHPKKPVLQNRYKDPDSDS